MDGVTREDIAEQIRAVLENQGEVNPSVITQKLQWGKDRITEICALFGVEKFSGVLAQIPGIEITKNEKGTAYAQLAQNDAETKPNAKTEETMASDTNIHDRIEKLRDALTDGLYEKEEAVRLSLLAAVAGESVFFLGAPGCAKSMIARRIKQAFKADDKTDSDADEKVTGGGGVFTTSRRCSISSPCPRTCSATYRSKRSTASLKRTAIKKSTAASQRICFPRRTSRSWTKSGRQAPQSSIRCSR